MTTTMATFEAICGYVAALITAYLVGLLMVDVQMDLTGSQAELRSYYCALTNSFVTIVGFIRMGLPVVVGAVIHVLLSLRTHAPDLRRLQRLQTAGLVFVGMPAVGVSISTCVHMCLSTAESVADASAVVRASHYVMLLLFAVCLWVQSYVLLSQKTHNKLS